MSGRASRAEAFYAVAALLGIEVQHTDALGVIHHPDAETLAAMVVGFGLPTEPERAAAILDEMRRAAPFGLDPLQIVPAEAPAVSLGLAEPVEWRLAFEEGGEAEGRLQPADGALRLPENTPLGYHRLDLAAGGKVATIAVAVAPAACYLPAPLRPGAAASWGLTAQLYGLRGGRGWGHRGFHRFGRR